MLKYLTEAMKRILSHRRLLVRIILSFSILLFLAVLALVVSFSRIYSDVLFEAVTAEYRDRLVEEATRYGQLHRDIENAYLTLSTSPSMVRFLNSRERSATHELAIRNELRRFLHARSEVHSISIYSSRFDYFISTVFRNDTPEENNERAFIDTIEDPFIVQPRLIRPNRPRPSDNEIPVLTYAFRVPMQPGVRRSDMVIINLKDPFAGNETASTSSGLILSTDGGRTLSPHSAVGSNHPALDRVLERVAASNDLEASAFRTEINGNEVVVSYKKTADPTSGLILTSVHQLDEITAVIRTRRNRLIWISFAVFLAGGLGVLLLARYVYRPVRQLRRRVSGQLDSGSDAESKSDDIEYLFDSFARTLQQVRSLESLNRSHVQEMRRMYLQRLVTDPGPASVTGKFLGDPPENGVRVCVVAIDGFHRVVPSNRMYYAQWLVETVPAMLPPGVEADVIPATDGMVAVAVWHTRSGTALNDTASWTALQRAAREHLNTSVTVGIGPVVSTFERARTSYQVALGCVHSRFTRDRGRVFDRRVIELEANEVRSHPDDLEEAVVQSVRTGHREELRRSLDKLERYVEQCRYDNARQICEIVYFACAKLVLSVHGASPAGHLPARDHRSISDRFREIETFGDFRRAIEEIFGEFATRCSTISQSKESRDKASLVEQIYESVQQDFDDLNLSVEALANRFGYSPTYFGRVFKQQTGESLNDLIRSVRVQRAKELLADTDIPVHEIALQVGFGSEKYFYHVFKRTVGLTPQGYRSDESSRGSAQEPAPSPAATE